jgi:protein gp37
MGDNTGISWCDSTWNIVLGCDKKSQGCASCWGIRDAWRLAHNPNYKVAARYEGLARKNPGSNRVEWSGIARCIPEKLGEPLGWKRSRRIFVCSSSDLFHEAVPDEFIDRVLYTMCRATQHTFLVLTKRPERMLQYFGDIAGNRNGACERLMRMPGYSDMHGRVLGLRRGEAVPNVWLGVTAENQEMADHRIPILLQVPAALRFASVEPMLGPVDLSQYLSCEWHESELLPPRPGTIGGEPYRAARLRRALSWVICGCESGPGRRPMELDWARSLRDQCQASGTAFFLKQADYGGAVNHFPVLDGRTWREFPEVPR